VEEGRFLKDLQKYDVLGAIARLRIGSRSSVVIWRLSGQNLVETLAQSTIGFLGESKKLSYHRKTFYLLSAYYH
jgi:hypothetical protein